MGGSNYSSIVASGGGGQSETFAIGGGATISPGNGFGTLSANNGGTINYGFSTINGGFLSGDGHHIAGSNDGITTFNGTTIDADATLTFVGQTVLNNVTNNGKIAISDPAVNVKWNYGHNGASGELDVNSNFAVADLQSSGLIQIAAGGVLNVTTPYNSPNPVAHNLVLSAGSRTYVGGVAAPGGDIYLGNLNKLVLGGLLVNNGTVHGAVDVNYGGLLEGAGTITGAVTVNTGGTVHADNSPGTLTTGGANWGAGGIYEFDIASASGNPGSDWSFWDMTGDLNITAGATRNSRFTIDIVSLLANDSPGHAANFDPNQSYSWLLATATSVNGLSASEFTLDYSRFANQLSPNLNFQIYQSGDSIYLGYAPEPGTWGMMLGALGVGFMVAKRRRIGSRPGKVQQK